MKGKASADRLERAARNQSIFREVNERLEGLADTFKFVSEMSTFTCECADLQCTAMVNMTLQEYEAVRSDPNEFVVLPGHVYPDVERVTYENERYVVVAKIGKAGEIARDFDPRK